MKTASASQRLRSSEHIYVSVSFLFFFFSSQQRYLLALNQLGLNKQQPKHIYSDYVNKSLSGKHSC